MIAKKDFRLIQGASGKGDIWTITQEKAGNRHPAPFPLELPKRIIESTEADIVLDPFLGSGTTAVAAEFCNRKWIGIDISKEYCDGAWKRIQDAASGAQINFGFKGV